MPAQKNERSPKFSDDALEGFREVTRIYIAPTIGTIPLAELDKKTVAAAIAAIPAEEVRAKVLYTLTRIMELAEQKGKRRKGTNPCKGVVTKAPRDKAPRDKAPRDKAPRDKAPRDKAPRDASGD